MMEWQLHQLDHMQVICTLLQTNNHASTSSLEFFTGWMLFLLSNQQRQITTEAHVWQGADRSGQAAHPLHFLYLPTTILIAAF